MSSDPQGGRKLRIGGAALPADTLLHTVQGRERLGKPFKFDILFSCGDGAPSAESILGSAVVLTLSGPQGDRAFHGIIAQFSLVELGGLTQKASSGRTKYRAIVRPRLWRLTRSSHCRFFHDKTVVDIAKFLLDEQSVPHRSICIGSYPKLDNCTQYRETDFNFLNRLLQREGIYYYFDHKDGTDTLVLVDDPQQHGATPNYESIPFNHVGQGDGTQAVGEAVYDWKNDRRVVPGRSETNAFDFENVSRSTSQGLTGHATSEKQGNKAYVIQEPALWYDDDNDGVRYAWARLDAYLPRASRVAGRATACGISPGAWFALTGHAVAEQNGKYLVTDVRYRMSDGYYPVGHAAEKNSSPPADPAAARRARMLFDCRFRAIPRDSRYRARCWAHVPVIGPQTAIVLAPEGEDFATDAHGRIKVQFHWEQFNPPSTGQAMQRCWVRVAQPWAGDRWGAMFLPRKGQEVLVDFLNGNPDKPVVVGGLYNGKNKTPYALPDAAAVSTILTQGTGAGNAGKRNELRFDDEKLQILLYTDGNQDNYTEHDSLTYVGHDSHTFIEEHQLIETKYQDVTVGASQTIRARDVSLSASLSVVHEAGEKYVIKSELVHIKSDATLVLEATAMLSLKAGGSFISIGPDGVHISGPIVYLNSGGAAGSGPGGSTKQPEHPKRADDGKSVKRN